jgi:hypothetical protein
LTFELGFNGAAIPAERGAFLFGVSAAMPGAVLPSPAAAGLGAGLGVGKARGVEVVKDSSGPAVVKRVVGFLEAGSLPTSLTAWTEQASERGGHAG